MFEVAINTLVFHGYPFDTALEEIARLAEYVEPVYISKYDPMLREDYFNVGNAQVLRRRLEQLGLKVTAMASHMDLGQPDAVDTFTRRMEFAQAIGARIILTNVGRRVGSYPTRLPDRGARNAWVENPLYTNLERLAVQAEKLDLVIALENPGDGQDQLLGTGTDGVTLLRKLGSDRVRLNYDFSNVFTYSRGGRRPEEELEAVLPWIAHLHMKNVKGWEGGWAVCGLEEGTIDYAGLVRQFPALSRLPMSIELPLRFGYDAEFQFGLRPDLTTPSLDHIRRILKDSLDHLAVALTI